MHHDKYTYSSVRSDSSPESVIPDAQMTLESISSASGDAVVIY